MTKTVEKPKPPGTWIADYGKCLDVSPETDKRESTIS
jgi:hypothetical protein